ncbi:MAG TPA: NADH-ubiquinone oxidoreductase-F iron-sulfur binding region domain-containing protein [Acidimicrobiales bacterium]
MTTSTLPRVERLLHTGPGGPIGPGLADHLALHGQVAIPTGDDPAWAEALQAEVASSGLAGRGGGGFPTAVKWNSVIRSNRRPVIVVNAMEGEPASAKDRALLAWSPHLVLDGAELVAALSGARSVVVCVADDRDDSARAAQRVVAERQRAGSPRVLAVRRPPARYVTGEESALVSWLEREDARPFLRVNKSVPLTIGRRPVLVHNAETLAQVALIARHGAAWFRQLGTADAPGTTLVTVSGAVRTSGVIEVELGTPVEDVVQRSGPTAPMSGYLVGGYGGAWLAPELGATPLAPAPLARAGASLGVGIVVALPTSSCGIAETARIARWMAGQSAGQCGPCVFGLPAIADDLELLAAGWADAGAVARIDERSRSAVGRGACRHPDGVAQLVRSALTVFAADAAAHAAGRPCAGRHRPTVLAFPAASTLSGGAS